MSESNMPDPKKEASQFLKFYHDRTAECAASLQRSNEIPKSERKPQGLLKSYHGVVYQIQWIMLVALQARKQNDDSGFTFRTEEEEEDVGKFDDVVWQYRDDLNKKYNFLQCKHRLDLKEKITMNELCKKAYKDKNPFSLQKYFISYRDYIKPNHKYKDGVIEILIIATNIDFNDNIKNNFKVVRNINPVLKVIKSMCQSQVNPRCWKIDHSCVSQDIINPLEETYDLIKLAKVLGEYIGNQLPFRLPDNLKLYSKALYDNILNQEENRLSDNFISGNGLSKQAEFLREAFFQEVFEKERMSLNMTQDYNLSDPAKFANEFSRLLQISEDKNVKIQRNLLIIRTNIDKLAGYVLIKEDGIKFHNKFWTVSDSELPHEDLITFRNILTGNLQSFGLLNVQDSPTTIANKLDVYRFNITSFVTCRKELIDELSFWENAKSYKGFKSAFNTSDLSKEQRDLPNYSLKDVRKNINDFFDLLVFAVGYSRDLLSQVVQYDLRADFSYIENEYLAESFRSEIAKCLDLVEDRFISTSEHVQNFFKTAKQQINRFILIGPTLEYRVRSLNHEINFSKNSTSRIKLRSFITNSSTVQVLGVIAVHNKLSSIKVHQILESVSDYRHNDHSNNYIFMGLSTILNLLDLVIQNFEFNYNLLVIECDTVTTSEDEQYLYTEICRILTQCSNKKVVLISGVDDYLINMMKNNLEDKYKGVVDKRNNFLNLTKSSQDNLLSNRKVTFQGEKVDLKALLIHDTKYLLNCDVLYKLIISEDIEIGVATSLVTVNGYYINRTFCRQLALEKEVFTENDMFAISNIDILELRKEINKLFSTTDNNVNDNIEIYLFEELNFDVHDPKRFVILNNELAINQFNILCHNCKENNIHWLNRENGFFIWQQTHGCLSNLHSYLRNDTKEYKQVKNEFIDAIKFKKVAILSAEPGMGKSTVTTNLESSLKSDSNLWIVRINLLHYSTDFKESIDDDFVIRLLYKAAKLSFTIDNSSKEAPVTASIKDGKLLLTGRKRSLKASEVLGIGLFNHYYNHGRVFILFDGYDEICSFYEKKVIQMLKILHATSIAQIFITTRPYNILKGLENTLNEFSYSLKPFDYDEQKLFLILYWKTNLNLTQINEQHANIFIEELLNKFSEATSDEEKKFVSIPLQLRMLADNFQDEFEEFYHSNVKTLNEVYRTRIKDKLDVINLYDEFVNIKFEKIRFKEKNPAFNNDYNDTLRVTKRERRKFMDDHQKLSIYALFHDDPQKLLTQTEIKKVVRVMKLIKQADDENGIINGIINNIPIFVHQTFAEYFASRYLWQKFKSTELKKFKNYFVDDLILNNIFTGNHLQLCRFLYFTAVKDLKKNISFIDKDNKIVALLESIVNIISSLYYVYWNRGSNSRNGTDDIHKFDNTDQYPYFKNANYVPCIKLLFRIVECYMSGIEPQNDAIAAVIIKDQTIHLLRMAGETGCLNFAKYFVNTTPRNYKEDLLRNKWYFTPLWLAAKNHHVEMVSFLSNIYNCNWTDKDNESLSQRIFNRNETDVLRSCLLSNIIDGRPYKDLNGYIRLPLVTALNHKYPTDIIKVLLKKSDTNVINEFDEHNLPAPYLISVDLLQYDSEITNLAIESGINFCGALNVMLFEYCQESLHYPTNIISFPNYSKCSFNNDDEYLQLYNVIETFLLAGVGFSTQDCYEKTTWQYSAQIYYIHKLINYIINIDQPLEILLKLMIETLLSATDKVFTCSIYGNSCRIVSLNQNEHGDFSLLPNRIYHLHEKIYLKSYKTLSSHLYKLRSYLEMAKEEINFFKKYPDSKTYNRIFIGYEEMLEYRFANKSHKTQLYKSLGELELIFFERILVLYIRQDYDIKAAFKEIAGDVLKTKTLSKWIIKQQKLQNIITVDDLLLLFNLEDIEINKELRKILSKIYACGGMNLLHKTWSNLYDAGQNNVPELLNSMTKYYNVSTKIYRLLKYLKTTYDTLTVAIKTRNFTEITNILQNVDSRYVKSVVNAQDNEYGSLLHYAVCKDDIELTKILLSHGANPNYKLDSHGRLLSFLENSEETLSDDMIPEDYKSYTPLHLAVIKANIDIIQLLRSKNADHNIKNNNQMNSYQLAEENLAIDTEKYQKVIDILKSESPSSKTFKCIETDTEDITDVTILQGSCDHNRKRKAKNVSTLQDSIKSMKH